MARRGKPFSLGGRAHERGRCPVRKRDVALLGDGYVAFSHRKWLPDGPKCTGRGEKALPLEVGDQS